jgi:hypothetical protein
MAKCEYLLEFEIPASDRLLCRMFEVRGRWLEWTGYRYTEQRITRQVSEFTVSTWHMFLQRNLPYSLSL